MDRDREMKIKYQETRFSAKSKKIIDTAVSILEEYAARGIIVTLRQLYYQFVARDIIPNKQSEYKRLGSIINDARLAGLIDWEHMQDRTRNLSSLSHWDSPAGVIKTASASYHRDLWEGQSNYVEVWIEKDALVGVIESICEQLDVPFFSCRGYTSQSEMWVAAMRMRRKERRNRQNTHIIHLGDHDPSGKDMSRDIQDRLQLFGSNAQVHRIALNMDQIDQYNPPPNPAKITDSRATGYIAEFGGESWELDALDPAVLSDLIEASIKDRLDMGLWEERKEQQEQERKILLAVSENWIDVQQHVEENYL